MHDETPWFLTFVLVLLSGILIIVATLPFGPEQMLSNAVRLSSIFLGVLAGVSLGEYLKIRSNAQSGRRLMRDLLAELLVNRDLLETGELLRKGFWILGIRSGRAEFLPEKQKIDLWHIYSLITHYNDDLQHLHAMEIVSSEEEPPSQLRGEVTRLGAEISRRIDRFLNECPADVVEAARKIVT